MTIKVRGSVDELYSVIVHQSFSLTEDVAPRAGGLVSVQSECLPCSPRDVAWERSGPAVGARTLEFQHLLFLRVLGLVALGLGFLICNK